MPERVVSWMTVTDQNLVLFKEEGKKANFLLFVLLDLLFSYFCLVGSHHIFLRESTLDAT